MKVPGILSGLLLCSMLSFSQAPPVGCMDNTIDQSTVCNLVPNSGFENGACDSWISFYGLNIWSMSDNNFPNDSRISDWSAYWGTADLYSRSEPANTFLIPNVNAPYAPPWLAASGLSVETYAPQSQITGLDNNRFMGLAYGNYFGEAIRARLREPLNPNLSYDLSFWVFNTCHLWNGEFPPQACIFFTDDPVTGSGPVRYYPENNTLQANPAITAPTFFACTDEDAMGNGYNGWYKVQFNNFSVPVTANPLEYLVIGAPSNSPDIFGSSASFIDDVELVPVGAVASAVISGPVIQCDFSSYEVVDADDDFIYTWTVTNATPSVYTGTSITPGWNSTTTGADITLVVFNGRTNCEGASATFHVEPCCEEIDLTDIQLNNETASNVKATLLGGGSVMSTADNIIINGIFTVDENFSFTGCPNIYLGKNAIIQIDPGVQLEIDDCTLQACGSEMWESILISDNTSELHINNSTLREAKCAVKSMLGGKYYIDNTTFENNYIGIELIPKTATQTFVNSSHLNSWQITNSTFTRVNPLITPYYGKSQPYCGIKVSNFWDGTNYTYGPGIFVGASNIFDNQEFGIMADQSSVMITSCTFTQNATAIQSNGWDMMTTPNPDYLPNMDIYDCTFDTQHASAVNALYSQTLSIISCDIKDSYLWVDYFEHEGSNMIIHDNDFNYTTYTAAPVLSSYWFKDSPITISDNTIQANWNASGFHLYSDISNNSHVRITGNLMFNPVYEGMRMIFYDAGTSPGNFSAEITNNYIEHPSPLVAGYSGSVAYGAYGCSSIMLHENMINYKETWEPISYGFYLTSGAKYDLECNYAWEGEYGFFITGAFDEFRFEANYMRNVGCGMWMNNAYVGDFGSSAAPADNVWSPAFNDPNPNYYTFPAVIWETANGSSSKYYYRPISNSNAMYPDHNIVLSGSLFKRVSATGPWHECTFVEDVGYPYLRKARPEGSAGTGSSLADVALNANDQTTRRRTAENLYISMKNMRDLIEPGSDVEAVFNSINGTAFAQLVDVLMKPTASREVLLSIMASIHPQRADEEALKTVVGFMLKDRMAGKLVLNENELSALEVIAKECPDDAGIAVVHARALLNRYFHGRVYTNPCEHGDLQRALEISNSRLKNGITGNDTEEIVLFPNPVSDRLRVTKLNGQYSRYSVIDMHGKKVLDGNLNGLQAIDIDVSGLGGGIYSFIAHRSNGTFSTMKMVKE